MSIHKQTQCNNGFTLVEVIISTLIVGLILSSIFYTLSFLNLNLNRLTDRYYDDDALLKSLSIIEHDLKSLSERSIRDEFGDYQPPLILNNKNDNIISFSRLVFDDVSMTQYTFRIEYNFSNNRLKRNIWNVLDRVQNSNFQTQFLDQNITDISILVANDDLQWIKNWPIGFDSINKDSSSSSIGLTTRNDIIEYQNISASKIVSRKLPLAFRIVIKHKLFGEVERVILSQI